MSLKGPSEYASERTLFGSNMDSSRRMAKIDYSDYLSGKWKDEKLKSQSSLGYSYNTQLENINLKLNEQKYKVVRAKNEYSKSLLNALNFNGLEPPTKANQYQVQDYGNLRKFNSSFDSTKIEKPKEVYPNLPTYQLNGSILDTGARNFTSNSTARLNNPEIASNVEVYKSADGTVYKHYTAPSGETIKEIDHPTKNVIHVPGKYHELYRQWASIAEIPQNIKHKFGSKQTEELLKDQIKVHDTLSKIYNTGIIKKNDKSESNSLNLNKKETDLVISEYYDLGNHLRHAISHGYPTVYQTSHKETVHNQDVSKEHMAEWTKTVESPHRRKTDWLSKWLVKTISANKLQSNFDEFKKSQKVFKLPIVYNKEKIVVEKKQVQKSKNNSNNSNKQTNKSKSAKQSKNNGFEDFVFEEPVDERLINQNKHNVQTDDEFWKYYEQNI